MSLYSIVFFIFLLATLALWWLLPNRAARKTLLAANLVFYAYWFPPGVIVLLTTTAINYVAARKIETKRNSQVWLIANILLTVGILIYFKYLGFFISALGTSAFADSFTRIILPLGISFYTFRGISYVVDVSRDRLKAISSFSDYLIYLAFFPQVSAGPIVRAREFFTQLEQRDQLKFNDWTFAIYRILRGLFLKLIISDHIAIGANAIFSSSSLSLTLPNAWLGALFFAVQIFCDFAGYSDIAIGASRLFGFKVSDNFDNPYLAASLSDFWRRWHISLSNWFRDYVYFPLARSEKLNRNLTKVLSWTGMQDMHTAFAILAMFTLSGLWHGANWTFIAWGFLHGIGIVVERKTGIYAHLQGEGRKQQTLRHGWGALVLIYIVLLWVPFRSESLSASLQFWVAMFAGSMAVEMSPAVINGLFWLAVFIGWQILTGIRDRPVSIHKEFLMRAEAWGYFAALLFISNTPTDFIYLRF